MVKREVAAEVTTIIAHDGSAVAYVHYVDALLYKKGNDCAGPTLVQHMVSALGKRLNSI